MSSYLFVGCMERLEQLIRQKVMDRKWCVQSNLGAAKEKFMCLSFFIDVILLFTEATIDQAVIVRDTLKRFSNASRLKVSIQKTKFYVSPIVRISKKSDILNVTVFQLVDELRKYLGTRLVHNKVT